METRIVGKSNIETLSQSDKVHMIVAFLIIVTVFGVLWCLILPPLITNSKLEKAVMVAESKDIDDGFCFDDKLDWWNNQLCVSRVANEERTAIVYTVVSAGRDGQYGTDDDYLKSRVDFNKSKIIGKWAGEKAVQVLKGWKEGLTTTNRHDK